MHATIIPEVTKRIAHNRESKDYDCFVVIDGSDEQYIGSATNYSEGETKCRDYAFSYYEDNHTPEKAAAIAVAGELPDVAPAIRIKIGGQWRFEWENVKLFLGNCGMYTEARQKRAA